jgi:hypothetical protein
MAGIYGRTFLARVTNRRDPLLGAVALGLQRGFDHDCFSLFLDWLPRFQRRAFCQFDSRHISHGSSGERSVLRRISRRSLRAGVRISRNMAKEQMDSVCHRTVVRWGLDAVLGDRDVRIFIQVRFPSAEIS